MSNVITNATPRLIHPGIRDDSLLPLPVVSPARPQHLPLFYVQSQRGPTVSMHGPIDHMTKNLGIETFALKSPYYSHAVAGLAHVGGEANDVIVRRLVDENATKATMVLWCEYVEYTFNPYIRLNGQVVTDIDGNKQVDLAANVTGYKLRWTLEALPADQPTLKQLAPKQPGTLVGDANAVSTKVPVFASRIAFEGEYGNNVGVRFYHPHNLVQEPGDIEAMIENNALFMRWHLMERTNAETTPQTQQTLIGSQFTDFALKRGVVSRTNINFDADKIVTSWTRENPSAGQVPEYGQVGEVYLYEDNIRTITELLSVAEEDAGGGQFHPDLINFFSGLQTDGYDHYGFRMAADTLPFNSTTTHYFQGGDDGEVSAAKLDELAREHMLNQWDDTSRNNSFLNRLKIPFSQVYDTGYSLETKYAMLSTLALRPDFAVTLTTQYHGDDENTIEEEIAVARALSARALLTPESTLHGTRVCRATIVGGTGKLNAWPGPLSENRFPLVFELMSKRARFAGRGTGSLVARFAYDLPENNRLTEMSEPSYEYANFTAREQLHLHGVNWAQTSDLTEQFFAEMQTVYPFDASVLNSDIYVAIAVDLIKQGDRLWTFQSGNTQSPSIFIRRSLADFGRLTANRYADRVVIRPRVFFTPDDTTRGFSWNMEVEVGGNISKTVGVYQLIAKRTEQMAA